MASLRLDKNIGEIKMRRDGLHEYIGMMSRWGNRIYLVGYEGYRKKAWTFQKARSTIFGLSEELKRRKIHKGDKIILFGRSSPEWVIAFFAIIHRGAVVIPLDYQTPTELFSKVYQKTSPSLIISENPIENSKLDSILFSSIERYETNLHAENENIIRTDIAEVVFTSGTTSDPKGVVLTHGNILSNLEPFDGGIEKRRKIIKILTPFRILCTVPFSHMFGQITGIFLPILLGSTVYFTHETGPAALIRSIHRDRILTLVAVPRVLKLLADHIKAEISARGKLKGFEKRWDRWVKLPYQLRAFIFFDIHRYLGLHFWSFIVGGAPLDAETHEFWRRLVYSVFQGYGLTETAPIVTMFNPFRHDRSSVGKVMPGQRVKIGPDGEILIKGENVMAGYWDDPEKTASVLKDGWFRTGDIGTIDKEGQIFIKGRLKDMIVTSDGHNVYPVDIEKKLNTRKGIRESVVIGLPEGARESIHAVLLLDPGADPAKIIKEVNTGLLPYQRIHGYTVWDDTDFPRTSTMKVRKVEILKKLKSSNTFKPEDREFFSGLFSGTANPDLKLSSDLGMDSLDLVEAVSAIEKKYNVSIDETLIGPDATVGDLEELASHPSASRSLTMPRWTLKQPVKLLRQIIMGGIMLPLFRISCKLKSHGIENIIEAKESGILAANHTSHLDPLAILLSLPPKFRKIVAPAMGLNRFHPYFSKYGHISNKKRPSGKKAMISSYFIRLLYGFGYFLITFLFQTYPFPQGTAYRGSLEYTGELLDTGRWILIFPEGEVSKTGGMGHFRGGISVLAEHTGAPVFPVLIDGMSTLLPPGKILPRRTNVDVYFGVPLLYREKNKKTFTEEIENGVRELKKKLGE